MLDVFAQFDEVLKGFVGVLLRGGGLHRRLLLVAAIQGGVGDIERPGDFLGRLTGDEERRRPGGGIS